MAKQFSFPFKCPPIGLLAPAADAAGRTSSYKSLRNCSGKVALVCRVNQGNAAQVTLTLLQAQNAAGLGAVIFPATYAGVFYNANVAASDTLVAQSGLSNTFQIDATIAEKIVMFEFDPAELLINSGYGHIAIQTSPSNAANITSALMQYIGRNQLAVPPASEV